MTHPRRFRIVVAVDFSDISDTVVEQALDAAARHDNPEIHAVVVRPVATSPFERTGGDHSAELEELGKRLHGFLGVKLADFGHPFGDLQGWRVSVHARAGVPAEEIADLAGEAQADLIVLGRHGKGRRRRFWVGAVPERVLRLAPCPVLVVRPLAYDLFEDEEAEPACSACVLVRRDSAGNRWYCDDHRSERLPRSAYMIPHGGPAVGGTTWQF